MYRILVVFISVTLVLVSPASLKAQVVAAFTSSGTDQCTGPVQFFDASTLPAGEVTYTWSFPGGLPNTSTDENPEVFYLSPGTYSVSLTACVDGSCDTEASGGYITIHDLPTADFDFAIPDFCNSLNAQFTDLSTTPESPIAEWLWDFDDAFTSDEQNPDHIYQNPGTYEVFLFITDVNGCNNSFSSTITVTDVLQAETTISETISCGDPIDALITAEISGGQPPYNLFYDFGNGLTSTNTSTNVLYADCDIYTITLDIEDDNGCTRSYVYSDTIEIFCAEIDYSFTPDPACVGNMVSFSSLSLPVPDMVTWTVNPDDPIAITSVPNPNYLFDEVGTIEISYCIEYDNGCSYCVEDMINVEAAPEIEGIMASDSASCVFPFTSTLSATGLTGVGPFTYEWIIESPWTGGPISYFEESPDITFDTYGGYDVTLVVTGALGCSDSLFMEKFIKVKKITPFFVTSDTSGCAPFEITIQNLSTSPGFFPITEYQWDFGDADTYVTSTSESIFHTYTETGDYTISLTAITADGCNQEYSFNISVGEITAFFEFDSEMDSVCGTVTVINTTLGADSMALDWGNGATTWLFDDPSGGISFSYNILDSASFDVNLTTFLNGCESSFELPIFVIPPESFNQLIESDCSNPEIVTITIDTSIIDGDWCWDFGDGIALFCNETTITYDFGSTGLFTVNIVDPTGTEFDGKCLTTDFTVPIVDSNSDFEADLSHGCGFLSVNFTNVNLDPVFDSLYYIWEIGPGSAAVPLFTDTVFSDAYSYAFTAPGTYPISVHSLDPSACGVGYEDTIFISGLTADISIDSIYGCGAGTVYFSDASHFYEGAPEDIYEVVGWHWEFGIESCPDYDGEIPPPCFYPEGNYLVSLTATDNFGCTSMVVDTLVFSGGALTANFTFDDISCIYDSLYVNNVSTGDIIGYSWDFGDFITSTDFEPPHFYTAAGNYPVTLTVQGVEEGCFESFTDTVFFEAAAPVASYDLEFLTDANCPPIPASLSHNSGPTIAEAFWQISNIVESDAFATDSLIYTFQTPGYHNINLMVVDEYGCVDTLYDENAVLVPGPTGIMETEPDIACTPTVINFDLIDVNADLIFIDFDDGDTSQVFGDVVHNYDLPGTYCPRLILIDESGCEALFPCFEEFAIGGSPVAEFEADSSLCLGDTIFLTNNSVFYPGYPISSYTAYLGDENLGEFGPGLSTAPLLIDEPGTYNVSLVADTDFGCTDSTVQTITIHDLPSANMNIDPLVGCAPLDVSFDLTDVTASSIILDTGDGNMIPISTSYEHTYTGTGLFVPVLMMESEYGCLDTIISDDEILVGVSPTAGMDLSKDMVCENEEFFIYNLSLDTAINPITSIIIDFGNESSTTTAPTLDSLNHSYNIANTYTISLIAENDIGCQDSATVNIQVNPVPIANAGEDILTCPGISVILDGTASSGGSLYTWEPPIGLSNTDTPSPEADLSSTQQYILTHSTGFCESADTMVVNVLSELDLMTGPDVSICFGQETELFGDLNTDVPFLNYEWSPSSGLDNSSSLNPIASPMTTTIYTLSASCGDLSESSSTEVTVNTLPEVIIQNTDPITIAASPLQLNTIVTSSSVDINYEWFPSELFDCPTCSDPYITLSQQQLVSVNVIDGNGCSDSDSVLVKVLEDCVGNTLEIGKGFTPNGDGFNDLFYFRSESILELDVFQVYNRWGEKIFETGDINQGWDGTHRGNELNPGVFVYQIKGTCLDYQPFVRTGSISLIR